MFPCCFVLLIVSTSHCFLLGKADACPISSWEETEQKREEGSLGTCRNLFGAGKEIAVTSESCPSEPNNCYYLDLVFCGFYIGEECCENFSCMIG